MDFLSISSLLDSVSQAVVIIDERSVTYANPAARECFGTDLTGKPVRELFPEEVLKNRAMSFGCSITLSGVPVSISVVRHEEYQTMYIEKAHAVNPMTVSPQLMAYLRNCAAGIKLAADRCFTKSETPAPADSEYVSALYHYYYSLMRLITQVDSAEKLRTGELAMQTVYTDLVKLCRELTQTVSSLCSDRGVSVQFICEEPELRAVVDPGNIELMLLNLFSNSLKNTPAGGSVSLTLSRSGDSVCLSMDDTGKGIPDEKLKKLFSTEAASLDLSSPEAGLGLGLYISGSIARLHNGVMLIETKEDSGTRIRIKFPAEETPSFRFNSPVVSYRSAGASSALTELADILKSNCYGPKFED